MNKYAQATLLAVERVTKDGTVSPNEAWEDATMKIFGPGPSQKKGCPKGAFLGLCEEGLIKGIAEGNYSAGEKNKSYAIRAADLLKYIDGDEISRDKIWNFATQGSGIRQNSQLDIVLALKENDLLNV